MELWDIIANKTVQKCKKVADNLGKRGNFNEKSQYSFPDFVYETTSIRILHRTFGKGYDRIEVKDKSGKLVFEAEQVTDKPIRNPEEVISLEPGVESSKKYRISAYTPGNWEQRLEDLFNLT